jgi:hypothetical protein
VSTSNNTATDTPAVALRGVTKRYEGGPRQPRQSHVGVDRSVRNGRCNAPGPASPRQHGVPGLCAVSAPRRVGQRRFRAQDAEGRQARNSLTGRRVARIGPDDRARFTSRVAALGRSAPASRARSSARQPPEGAARRTAGRARPATPSARCNTNSRRCSATSGSRSCSSPTIVVASVGAAVNAATSLDPHTINGTAETSRSSSTPATSNSSTRMPSSTPRADLAFDAAPHSSVELADGFRSRPDRPLTQHDASGT